MTRLLKAAFWIFAIATPLAGVWLASSLAAYLGWKMEWAALAGLLVFPILPVFWVGLSEMRRRRRAPGREHVLTFGDRLLWRTLLLSVSFLSLLLWKWPQQSFLALSTRGDWMLEGKSDEQADRARHALLAAAGGIEWVYLAAHPNPYVKDAVPPPPPPSPEPEESATPEPAGTAVAEATREEPEPSAAPTAARTFHARMATPIPSAAPIATPRDRTQWPVQAELDPVVRAMPSSAEASIESIGRYIASRTEGDPFRRAKAIHDYVADRIAYDFAALRLARIPDADADAETVWKNRRGVCAGYANLYVAIAKAADVEAVYLTGDARDTVGGTAPQPHAWNAVRIRNRWYLLDATWDAGSSDPADGGQTFHKRFSTLYLFTPPEIFGLDHFPDEDGWQLRATAIRRADFLHQPLLRPQFAAEGLTLLAPARPQVTAQGSLDLKVGNPRQRSLLVTAKPRTGAEHDCTVTGGDPVEAHCTFDHGGEWRISLYSSGERYAVHDYVAGVDVNASL